MTTYTVGQQIDNGEIVVASIDSDTGMISFEFPNIPSDGPGSPPETLIISPNVTIETLEAILGSL